MAGISILFGEDGCGDEGLVDLVAVVGAGSGGDGGVVADEGDVGAFAGHQRLADVVAHASGAVEVRFQQELVVGVELPEDGEDALVGEEHLPDRLDPACGLVGGEGVGAELLLQHGLPGVELEDGEDGVVVEVHEGLLGVVPADVLHGELAGVEVGLLGGVAEVRDGEQVFF